MDGLSLHLGGKEIQNESGSFKLLFTGVRLGLRQYRLGGEVNGKPIVGTYVIDSDPNSGDGFVLRMKYGREPYKKLDITFKDTAELEDKLSTYVPTDQDYFLL